MGTVLLAQERQVNLAPNQVFDSITSSAICSWLFNASCRELRVGEPVTFEFPTAGFLECATINVLGRITEFRPWSRLVIEYEAPFDGRLICSVRYTPRGTQVRLILEVSETAITWFLRRQGLDLSPEPEPGFRIGVLLSKSGPASVFSAASENLARMAVAEVNENGGIHGQPVRLSIGDDGTDAALGSAAFTRLTADLKCSVVITNTTSATFEAIQPLAIQSKTLLLHTPVHEGQPDRHNLVIRLGERSVDQLAAAVPTIMKETGGQTFYLAGNDYVWPRSANRDARKIIDVHGGRIAGEGYEPLGTRDFTKTIEAIDSSGADIVISSFVGADKVAFQHQSHRAGIQVATLGLALDEGTHEHLDAKASDGLWSAFNYFQDLRTEDNTRFLQRYRTMYGDFLPPTSSISRSIYDGVHLVARSANASQTNEPQLIAREIRRANLAKHNSPQTRPRMLLARSTKGKLKLHSAVA